MTKLGRKHRIGDLERIRPEVSNGSVHEERRRHDPRELTTVCVVSGVRVERIWKLRGRSNCSSRSARWPAASGPAVPADVATGEPKRVFGAELCHDVVDQIVVFTVIVERGELLVGVEGHRALATADLRAIPDEEPCPVSEDRSAQIDDRIQVVTRVTRRDDVLGERLVGRVQA